MRPKTHFHTGVQARAHTHTLSPTRYPLLISFQQAFGSKQRAWKKVFSCPPCSRPSLPVFGVLRSRAEMPQIKTPDRKAITPTPILSQNLKNNPHFINLGLVPFLPSHFYSLFFLSLANVILL